MPAFEHLVGKVFKRAGGKYPGVWIVVGLTPAGGCICLGWGNDGNLVGAANYQPYYVNSKKTLATINIEDIRFLNDTTFKTDPASGDGSEEAPSLPAILSTSSSHDGGTDRTGEALVP